MECTKVIQINSQQHSKLRLILDEVPENPVGYMLN